MHCATTGTTDGFVSRHVLLAARGLNECLLALAVTDLPLDSSTPPDIFVRGDKLVYRATKTPLVVFHKVRVREVWLLSVFALSTSPLLAALDAIVLVLCI